MKKLRIIAGSILRAALLLSPGIISFLCVFHNYPLLVNIMSSIGVEFCFALLVALVSIIFQAIRDNRKK